MHWHDVQSAWDRLGDQIQSQWPAMRAFDLAQIAGDRRRFTEYLADVHHLTRSEAEEAIDLWLMRIRAGNGVAARAG